MTLKKNCRIAQVYENFIKLVKMDDLIYWKTNSKTKFYLNIGGFSQELKREICLENGTDQINGYNHVGKIDLNENKILHSHPPQATIDDMTFDWFCKEVKHNDLEIWRLKQDIGYTRKININQEFRRLVDFKYSKIRKKMVGAKYDWSVFFTLPFALMGIGMNARNWYHCAEIVFDSDRVEGIIDSSEGINDALVSPNNIINSGLRRKVFGYYADEDKMDIRV